MAVERELSVLGQTNKGMNDVFRHCRGFERAYSAALQEANVAFKIRAVVEGNLPESLHRIPIEKRFNKAYVREICREADGYQPHLVSPERGIRRLVAEAMRLTKDHVHRFVDEIHMVLLETVRDCARKSVAEEAGVSLQSTDMLRLRGFENAVNVAAQKALELWQKDAHRVADIMVQMEIDYITPSAFRELERQFQEEHALMGGGGVGRSISPVDGDDPLSRLAAGQLAHSPSTDTEDYDSDNESTAATDQTMPSPGGSSTTGGGGMPSPQQRAATFQRDDLKAGYLEKRVGDQSSLAAMPVESWRWQRRWFVLAMEPGYLYYFKNQSEMMEKSASTKNTINLRECVVEDYQPEYSSAQKGGGTSSRRSTQKLPENAGNVSLLIRISHKNPNRAVYKDHPYIILRAADAAEKYDWLARLRNATEPTGGAGKAPRISGNSAQYIPAGKDGGVSPGNQAVVPTPANSSNEQRGLFGKAMTKVTGTFSKTFSGFGGSRLGNVMEAGSIEDLEAYYERLGTFCGIYAREVFNRMAKTVPKAIILCQVIKSRDRLLDQLYDYISSLKGHEIDALLQEDPILVKRRAAAQQAAKDLGDAQAEVRRAQEVRASGTSPRDANADVTVRALLLAGAFPLVPKDAVPGAMDVRKMYGEGTPMALMLEGVPPALGPPKGAEKGGSEKKPTENGAGGGGGQKAAVPPPPPTAAAASAAAASAASKPRRMPPPPPPNAK